MLKLKQTLIGASLGFIVSFFVGLFSEVSFGLVLLRAVISFVVSGVIINFVAILFEKMLFSEVPSTEKKITKDMGTHVDIVLDDVELPDSASAPAFEVFNHEDIKSDEKKVSDSFVPITPGMDTSSLVDTEVTDNTNSEPSEQLGQQGGATDNELDELPELDDVVEFSDDNTKEGSIIEDSDFAEFNLSKTDEDSDFVNSSNVKDIAAAIRTVLKKSE